MWTVIVVLLLYPVFVCLYFNTLYIKTSRPEAVQPNSYLWANNCEYMLSDVRQTENQYAMPCGAIWFAGAVLIQYIT